MPLHADFKKIYTRFTKQYGEVKGKSLYYAWLKEKGYDDTKPFPKAEKKEKLCSVVGLEIKEKEGTYYVSGLIATSHRDNAGEIYDDGIDDVIPKETLESFAHQINTLDTARVMGIHHSEGRSINPEYFGVAEVGSNPASVIELSDGEYGLFVTTELLKDDPGTPDVLKRFQEGDLNSFSITYDTNGFMTTDFMWIDNDFVRILNPETRLYGYTAANNPVNPNAVATEFGIKEFKELVGKGEQKSEVKTMTKEETKEQEIVSPEEESQPVITPDEEIKSPEEPDKIGSEGDPAEGKESLKSLAEKLSKESKEILENAANKIAEGALKKMEVKEQVLIDNLPKAQKEVSLEVKAFKQVMEAPKEVELKEQFRRAAAICDTSARLDWRTATTSPSESREYKTFSTNGRFLEYKGLGITTNQNTDTDYLQSTAELQDVYDPVIYNALNQATVTWNLLQKDDYSKKGNNQVQFVLKTAANPSSAFYTDNAVSTDNVTRLKYQTKFKKLQVGVSVDGDMIAAARGGPVGDVFAQEVMDSTMDMLATLNSALFAEVGLETASACIGFEYISDSAGNTTLYNLTRSAANKLSPDSAADTYINGNAADITMTNLRAAKRQAVTEGANKANLVYVTSLVQGDMLRTKMDDARRLIGARDSQFGFATDLWVDGIPVYEDKDCNDDDWWCIDLETHRVAIWYPPTIERLAHTADSQDAFIKMYFATYNRAPRRLVQIYNNATS